MTIWGKFAQEDDLVKQLANSLQQFNNPAIKLWINNRLTQ